MIRKVNQAPPDAEMGKEKDYGYGRNYAYHQPPSAPTLDITINQLVIVLITAFAPVRMSFPRWFFVLYAAFIFITSWRTFVVAGEINAMDFQPRQQFSVCVLFGRPWPRASPPSHPPPPPPSYSQPEYNPMWLDRFPRRENRGMFRLCLVEAMLAMVIMGGGIWCYRDTPDYCPYYSAIWTSFFYLLNSAVGSAAAKMGSMRLYLAHLVLSMISIMMCLVSGGLSARNWAYVGTYSHPKIAREHAFCLLGQHDPARISYIFKHADQYDFGKCLFELKVGVAVNSVQFVVAAIEVFLNFLSVILCMKRTCATFY
ncbi:hypothetical protein L596_023969 [Steinernema carpocapsae]|uniref:Uncharacterized protein n=1 Tax=Steinernema carpocapsae TaxID=34508 RepID=A0A4U5MFB2_STECR|nr:hypothetical protein L596_023969 [Steinernema carpocapsae]